MNIPTAPAPAHASTEASASVNPGTSRPARKTSKAKIRLVKETGTDKEAALAELAALLDWPGLYHLSGSVDEQLAKRRSEKREEKLAENPASKRLFGGRRQGYPTPLMILAIMAARITGSQASALTELGTPVTWAALGEAWRAREENLDVPFPGGPPNRDQVRYFRQHLEDPQMLECLQEAFQKVAVAQARRLGNFDPNTQIDWTNPSLVHTVIGDGMVLEPFSKVKPILDPVTGEVHYQGSRAAQGNPRVSPGSDLSADGKSHLHGINHVILQTRTAHGPVVLATGHALGAELWEALDLFDQLAEKLDGAVHNLLWDRVFTGWVLDYMLGRHRVRVFNKAVADNAKTAPANDDASQYGLQRFAADDHLNRINDTSRYESRLADAQPTAADEAAQRRAKHEQASLFAVWRTEELYRIHYSNAPVPLGVSLYPSTSARHVTGSRNQRHHRGIDVVRSRFKHFGVRTHQTSQGTCDHDLYVDDDALHEVVFDGDLGCYVKVATAQCLQSTPRGRAGGRWGTSETWLIPCSEGDFEITTAWNPHGARRRPGSDKPKQAIDPVLSSLRPISRSQHQAFADIANHRNDAESWNNWYQRRLPNYGRAASLSVEGQMLDLLSGGCVRNALTWAEWMRTD